MAATVIYTDMLGDDPEKVKQSRAAEVIDKLAQLAHWAENESDILGTMSGPAGSGMRYSRIFEALTEAIELLQDAYEQKGGD